MNNIALSLRVADAPYFCCVGCYRYNDVPLIYDMAIYEQLRDADIDHLLAQHIAHLFIRDSVSLFSEKVDQDDEQDTDHFEVCHI